MTRVARMTQELPDELIVEIISWMPPRNAFQLCCLSKEMYYTFTSEYFRSLHIRHLRKKGANSWFWRYSTGNDHRAYTIISKDHRRVLLECHRNCSAPYAIIGIINGVVCLPYVARIGLQNVARIDWIFLWNPVIKRRVILPPTPRPDDCGSYRHSLGFAYDNARNDYKVFSIWSEYNNERPMMRKPRLHVFSKNNGEWAKVKCFSGSNFAIVNASCAAFFEGSCHWVVYGWKRGETWQRCFVVALDASDYSISLFDVPDTMQLEMIEQTRVAIVGGCVALIPCRPFAQENELIIWVMKEYGDGSSWIWRYRIMGDLSDISRVSALLTESGEVMHREMGGPIWKEGLQEVSLLPYEEDYLHRFGESLELLDDGKKCKCFCFEDLFAQYWA